MSATIAIVGAGPSGCYVAQALLKARDDMAVDVFDHLPVPFGLVRYGVAADHQGTKAIVRQFERVFTRHNARFIGNVTIGRDLTLDALRAAYDVVVLAAGLSGDRTLGIPGEELAGVCGAGALTRALNEHPDAGPLPRLGPRVIIMGNGNVAIDLLRLLAKTPGELDGSDLGPGPTAWLAEGGVREITIVGRSPAARARFDPVMIKELGKLSGVSIRVVGLDPADAENGGGTLTALAAIDGMTGSEKSVVFRFGLTPVSLRGRDGEVSAAVFTTGDGDLQTLPCDAFFTAIGFQDAGLLDRRVYGAAALEGGVLAPGLYAAGWFRRGPRGTIPDNRTDAQDLARRILDDLDAATHVAKKPGRIALPPGHASVDFAGWRRIDAVETTCVPPGRCRQKIASRAAMIAAAQETEEVS